ncbi:DUF432 domain-containing protein [Methanoregula sp.]|uniref:DUF432 domain-containing protein n=1 Tax=Methanoregula sp. TaxID=2052170 RepID=UPI0035685F3F
MFGHHPGDFSYTEKDFSLTLDRSGPVPRYERQCGNEKIKKILAISPEAGITISPVEPVNLPIEIAHHLEIVFPTIVMQPGESMAVNLKFPVEIGVFLLTGTDTSVIDIFSKNPVKYSLYGKPVTGLITRYYESDIYQKPPSTDPHFEGVMTLTIKNRYAGAVEVSRAVFECHAMKLFYGSHVGMNVTMEIISSAIAVTSFEETPPPDCPNRGIDLYSSRKLPIIPEQGFYMESGVI